MERHYSRQTWAVPLVQQMQRQDGGQHLEQRLEERDSPRPRGEKLDEDPRVRRGGRLRRQLHSNLAEDNIASAASGSSYDDGLLDKVDLGLAGPSNEGNGTPQRFRSSTEAPWGSGAQPLIKVMMTAWGKPRERTGFPGFVDGAVVLLSMLPGVEVSEMLSPMNG